MNDNDHYNQKEDVLTDDPVTGDVSELVVYDDDYNTFDWVIQCFMEVCNYSEARSEQLSLLVHFKGEAVVKTAPLGVLRPLKDELAWRKLSAVIKCTGERS